MNAAADLPAADKVAMDGEFAIDAVYVRGGMLRMRSV